MASKYPNVAPGEIVPGGFTYPNNAQVVGDDLYIRDINGKEVSGRQVDNGDKITVLDVSYSRQLTLVQYPAGSVVRQGYVRNIPSIIKYYNQGQWHNGSTPEEVLDENGEHLGSLKPYESATPLYKENGMTHVVYETDKGMNTKSGYVRYEGSAPTITTIPTPSTSGAQKIVYGSSGKGRQLAAYKLGNGRNSLVLVCAVHGWEDNWPADGIELVKIGNSVVEYFANNVPSNFSLYVIPIANPDGLSEGYTNNGPGRCTIVGGVDINRDFPLGFTPHGTSRYWTGDAPLSVPESRNLRDFIQGVKNNTSGEMIVIDLHGWEGAAIGNAEVGQYFRNQFGFEQRSGYGEDRGFLIAWAKSIGAKSALIELPTNTYSHSDVVNDGYSQKIINAVKNLMSANGSANNVNGWVPDGAKWYYYENGSMVTGWKQVDKIWYYLGSDGVMVTGWKQLGGVWYYLQPSGAMATGWLTLGDKTYYLDGSGHMLIGEQTIDRIKYTFNSSGELILNDPAPDIPGFQTLEEIDNSIRNILTNHFGFSASIDTDKPIARLITPNATIEASVGTTHTFSKEGDAFNLTVTNNEFSMETGDALLPIKFVADYQKQITGLAASIKFGVISLKLDIDGSVEMKISMKTNVAVVIEKVKYLKIKITPNKNIHPKITNELLQSSFEESHKYLPSPIKNEYKIMLNLELYLVFALTVVIVTAETIYNIYKAFKLSI